MQNAWIYGTLLLITTVNAAPAILTVQDSPVKSGLSWLRQRMTRIFGGKLEEPDTTTSAWTSSSGSPPPLPLVLCSWNIFRFGPNKFSVPDPLIKAGKNVTRLDIIIDGMIRVGLVMQLRACDVAVIQELDDKRGTVSERLRRELEKRTGNPYSAIVSPRVGLKTFEQYLLLYRTDKIVAGRSAVYPDSTQPDERLFHRQPWFTILTAKDLDKRILRQFVLGTIHTAPEKAVPEITSLQTAFDWARKNFSGADVMTMGDYNADCSYVRARDWPKIPLWTDRERLGFGWLVPTGVDTTSMTTHCTYDRAVYRGQSINDSYIEGSLESPSFPAKFGLTPAQAKLVSDHKLIHLSFS